MSGIEKKTQITKLCKNNSMEQRSSLGAAQLGKKFPAFHSQQLIYILSQF